MGGGEWGTQACIKQRAGQTTLSSLSYERCVNLNTTTCLIMNTRQCMLPRCDVESGISALRVEDSRPSYQQQDRQVTWQQGRQFDQAARRHLRSTVPLAARLTDGSRVFGAGSRPLLVKMVVQVPSCEESRADKLMDNDSRDTELCRCKHLCQ